MQQKSNIFTNKKSNSLKEKKTKYQKQYNKDASYHCPDVAQQYNPEDGS